ncbi:MAG TPA: hypothetical protein VHO24_01565 [Opitutaceae bacterium]|nr:hypothetical protein [Opitutaceae bacterium]
MKTIRLCSLFAWLTVAAAAADSVTLNWLGGSAPAAPTAVSWGVPWPKGAVQPNTRMRLTTTNGSRLEVQTWPLAFWPDGSVKWTGHAIASGAGVQGPLQLIPTLAQEERGPVAEIKYTDEADAFTIDTGTMRARIPKQGGDLIESLTIRDRVVATHGKLIARREDRTTFATDGIVRMENFYSRIESVVLEQSGPVRAVVKITGKHQSNVSERAWLPFTVRLHFFATSGEIKLTHSFIYDGDPNKDFIKGLGLSFTVPFKEEPQNRHIRFVGDGSGVWAQPVRMLPGYRSQAGEQIAQLYPQHLAGELVPNLADLDERTRSAILSVPLWADAKLTQLGPNNWSIFKRTTADASWLHFTDGHRARGLAVLGDVSGGLAMGVKDFWQKAGKSFEITRGASEAGELKLWLWSPDGDAMDLRRYDEIPHGLAINYEDWKPGWGTPLGIANTHDITLWAFDKIPVNKTLVALAEAAAAPPILVCTPEYYHAQQAAGRWSLPDRSTPTLRWVEDQVETFVNYYRDQVEERSWYGFWDFGDIMHNYDFGRHEWRYDVGGWAWVNTELMPDMLLWYSFLRTGRADLFRMAEAMTRHTSEVDVHHIGPFAPLGSRHNVNHWGDGAKQPRVSHAGLKRHYYFLTGGDGRIGDLLREQINADLTFNYLQRFNASHYVPNPDGTPRLDIRQGGGGGGRGQGQGQRPSNAQNAATPAGAANVGTATTAAANPPATTPAAPPREFQRVIPAPRPENFEPLATTREPFTRFGLEWMCYALNWTTEWERGGDQSWRTRLEADMKTMAANVDANGRFTGRYFDMIFGGPENMWEMEPMYDIPEFWRAWVNTSEAVGRQVEGGQMTGPRMLAYAASVKKDAELGRMAWEKLIGPPGKLPPLSQPKRYTGPEVHKTVTDPAFLGAPVGWQLHGVASIQWALNAIETLEFAKEYLPAWETAPAKPAAEIKPSVDEPAP